MESSFVLQTVKYHDKSILILDNYIFMSTYCLTRFYSVHRKGGKKQTISSLFRWCDICKLARITRMCGSQLSGLVLGPYLHGCYLLSPTELEGLQGWVKSLSEWLGRKISEAMEKLSGRCFVIERPEKEWGKLSLPKFKLVWRKAI